MKPTNKIPAALLKNEKDFQSDFYRRFVQKPKEIQLKKGTRKTYQFPTFYGDVTCAQAIFHCDYSAAAKIIARELHPSIRPVRMTKGRSLVAFSCYEYNKVMGIAPYNEIAVALPVMAHGLNLPVLPMVLPVFKGFGYFVLSMPVTSYENTLRGQTIWGLPKVTQRIDIENEGSFCVTRAWEEKAKKPYFTLKVPTTGKPTDFDVSSYLYSRLNVKILKSETNFRATFAVNKFMNLLFQKNPVPAQTYLEIGDGKSAAALHELQIEQHPFQLRYAQHMESCFDLGEADSRLG